MIELSHLRKEYPNAVPLKDVSVTINDGDIIAVIGPSGTGKSTLIRCINMLEKPTSGKVYIDGVDITDRSCDLAAIRKKVGMVFQSFNLFDNLTVIENVMRPPIELLNMDKQEAYDRAMDLLEMVGMETRQMNYPHMLSGGQKQRVAIARTLSMDPDIILLDEPTSALDPAMVSDVEAVIKKLTSLGKTIMIVTHEMRFAREISNRVFFMDQGGIYMDGTPEEVFDHPEDERIRKFLRLNNKLQILIDNEHMDFVGNINDIMQYGIKEQIPSKVITRMQSAFEELCHQIILPALDKPKLLFTAEYRQHEAKAYVKVLFNGKSFDPRTTDNEISLKLLENVADIINYTSVQEDDYSNLVTLTF